MSAQYWQQLNAAYKARQITWLICALLLAVLLWAGFSKLEEVVVGVGKVVPSSSVQKISSLEGGILKTLRVEEGQIVKAGQVLLELDDTRFKASVGEAASNEGSLAARKARLQAELSSVTLSGDSVAITTNNWSSAEIPAAALASEQANYSARINELRTRVARAGTQIEQANQGIYEAQRNTVTLGQNLKLLEQEMAQTRTAVESGALPMAELRKLDRDKVRTSGELAAARLSVAKMGAARTQAVSERSNLVAEYRARVQAELAEVDSKLSSSNETRPALQDQLTRTRLTSPVYGAVKNIEIRSVGGVIKPGEPIMEIVPLADKMQVEARVSPRDIGFIREGFPATVKFTAYDFTIYGGIQGKVIYVSNDALQDEKGQPYYRVKVATDSQAIGELPIIPGMQASVDIVTGKKSVLSYWLKPLLRARANALRER